MNSNQLKQFIAIADEENITRASQKLFMSQSALSNTLKLLEEELGCQLFDRKANRLVLNANGAKLFRYAKQVVDLIDSAEREFRTTRNQKLELNIATSSHLYFTSFFKNNVSLMGKYHLKVVECSYSDIFDLLDRKNCDAALAPDYPQIHKNLGRFKRFLLGKEHLGLIFPVNHPLSTRESVSIKELNGEQFLSFENDVGFRWQDYLCMAKGVSMEYCLELPRGYSRTNDITGLNFPSFLSSLVKNSVTPDNPLYRYVPLNDEEATRNVYLWYKEDSAPLVETTIKEFL